MHRLDRLGFATLLVFLLSGSQSARAQMPAELSNQYADLELSLNNRLIYRDPEIACLSPIPLRPRGMPPVAPELAADRTREQGVVLPGTQRTGAGRAVDAFGHARAAG